MRKARKKAVAIIVALTFLLGLVFAYAGPAAADTTYGNYSGAYQYVETGTNQEAGYASVTAKTYWGTEVQSVYVTVTLPSGVTYNTQPSSSTIPDYVYVNNSPATQGNFYDATKSSLTVKITASSNSYDTVKFIFDRDRKSRLDIASDVSGDIKATIEILGVDNSGKIQWTESGTVTIARVTTKAVTVTAGDPKVIQVGSNKPAANITIQESRAKTLSAGEAVYLEIQTPDVKFASAPTLDYSADMNITTPSLTYPTNIFYFTVSGQSAVLPGKITVKLDVDPGKLNVPPSVSGDINITVYSKKSDGTSGKISATTLTVAKVGDVAVAITDGKYTNGTLYAGYNDAQTVKEGGNNAEFKLKASGGTLPSGKVVVLTLSAGTFGSTPFKIQDKDGNELGWTLTPFNDNKSVWFETYGSYSELKLTNFSVKVPGDAPEGSLVVKVSGTAGAAGDVTIGKIAKPFTVSATAPELRYPGLSQAAGDIVITETAAGKILAKKLYLQLPEGITFDGKPKVEVTAGNISVSGNLSTDAKTLEISVSDASEVASTIKISNVKYNVARSALEGDVAVSIYGEKPPGTQAGYWDGKTIAKVVNAKVIAPQPPSTKREASFVIGSTTYKVNGEEKSMDVAPYIDAASGRTYLPVRYVAYALGVSEDNIFYSNGQVSLLKDGRAVQMTIGSKALVVNGVSITMDAAPVIKDGRTMLPFRWIATALGASVQWDEATKTVTMNIE